MAVSEEVKKESPGAWVTFDPNPRRSLFYLICRSLFDLFVRVWFRPQIEGSHHVGKKGAVILAPVHRSFIDFAFTALITRRKLFFMAKDSIWKHHLLGRLLVHLGVFPVDRDNVDRTAFDRAGLVLERGQVLVIFPEGTRREGPVVENLFEGVALLSARYGAPVIPIGIGGSDRAMPRGKLPRPQKIQVVCGTPVPAPERSESGRLVRSALRNATEQINASIQSAYDEARQRDERTP